MTKNRCSWAGEDQLYIDYHDREWGVPVYDDRLQFEFLVLEAMQAGLSWLTVLKKRDNFRKAFAGFDPAKVARFSEAKVEKLMQDPGIIRNRLKIDAAINNAAMVLRMQKEYGGFSNYLWDFVGGKPVSMKWSKLSELPAQTDLSVRLSKDLKRRGFRFVGPTVVYAHLQAAGFVNDHLVSCFRHREVQKVAR